MFPSLVLVLLSLSSQQWEYQSVIPLELHSGLVPTSYPHFWVYVKSNDLQYLYIVMECLLQAHSLSIPFVLKRWHHPEQLD